MATAVDWLHQVAVMAVVVGVKAKKKKTALVMVVAAVGGIVS
jgi:hypothetical protein